MEWCTACPDWEKRLLAGKSPIADLPIDRSPGSEAAQARYCFEHMRIPDIPGTPENSEVVRPWVFDLVDALFGSYDTVTRRRRITEYFLLVPKKNGKSSLSAAIMLTAAMRIERPNAEFLLIAPTKEIANISFKQAASIINLDPALKNVFQIQSHLKTITYWPRGSTIQIKAADEDTITGSKSTGILVDETHVFSKRSNAQDVFVEIRGALASRPDGFMLQISTQSKDPPAGVFKNELARARDVRDGKLKMPMLPMLYELPRRLSDDGGWKNRKLWPIVNPNLGASVYEPFLVDQLTNAERDGLAAMALLASQHFNVEIGQGMASDRWVGTDFWSKNVAPALDMDSFLAACDVVVAGIDGGGLDDLLGFCLLGRHKVTKKWLMWTHAWAHKIVLERRKEIAPRLQDFVKDGDLTIVERPGDDVDQVVGIIEKVEKLGLFPEKSAIGVDSVGIGDIVDALTSDPLNFELERIVGISQGWKLTGAIKTTERKLAGGELIHSGSPLMKWCVGNAKVVPAGNAVAITKQAAGSAKIDPLMALFDAVSLMALNPEAKGAGSARALIL